MRIHFFTAPFYFAFIWFKVQGSRGGFAAFFRRWYSRIAAFPSRGRCPEVADRALAVWKRVGKAEKCVVYESNRAPHILAAKPPPSFLICAKLLSPMKGRHAPRDAPEPMTPSFPIPWPAPLHFLRCASRHGGRGSFYFESPM